VSLLTWPRVLEQPRTAIDLKEFLFPQSRIVNVKSVVSILGLSNFKHLSRLHNAGRYTFLLCVGGFGTLFDTLTITIFFEFWAGGIESIF
jgi:hypothetical protein